MGEQRADRRRPGPTGSKATAALTAVMVTMLVLTGCTDSPADTSTGSTVAFTTQTAPDGGIGPASSLAAATPSPTEITSGPTETPPTEAPTTIAPTTTTTTTTIAPSTTTTIALVTEGALVLVANAAGVPGAAAQLSATLQAVGYSMKEPTNAAGYEESLDASKIYFLPAAEAAARSLALVMQINSVSRMPTPAPILDAQVGLADATILIMLGSDLAGVDIPGFAGR